MAMNSHRDELKCNIPARMQSLNSTFMCVGTVLARCLLAKLGHVRLSVAGSADRATNRNQDRDIDDGKEDQSRPE